MKVLHFIPSLEVGGTERMLLTFLANAKNKQVEHSICTIYDRGALREEAKRLGIPYYTLGIKSKFLYPLAFLKFFFLMQKINCDIIHSYLLQDNLIARIIGKLYGKKVVCGKRDLDRYKNQLKVIFDRMTLGLANLHISNSKAGLKELLDDGVDTNRAVYIPNGKEIKEAKITKEAAKKMFGFSKSDIVVGVVARLYKYKGHEYAIKAMETLPENVKLVIVGDGAERSALEKLSSELNLNKRIAFLGERRDVPQILRAFDIFVLPSLREGLSGSIMEAMANGLPVIAADINENHELIDDGETGLLVKPADADFINGAIRRLMNDKKLAERLGKNAKEKIIKEYSISRMVNGIEEQYVKLWTRN